MLKTNKQTKNPQILPCTKEDWTKFKFRKIANPPEFKQIHGRQYVPFTSPCPPPSKHNDQQLNTLHCAEAAEQNPHMLTWGQGEE